MALLGAGRTSSRASTRSSRPATRSGLALADGAYGLLSLVLVGVAVVAGIHDLAAKSFWLDEAVAADHATATTRGLWKVISGGDPNGGLYYVALHLWQRIFGAGPGSLRSLSVVFGALAVIALTRLGARLFGREAGVAGGALLALAPFFVQYEQTARMYTLLVLLVTLSSYSFVAALEEPAPRRLALYVLTSALAVYAHYVAVFVLVVQASALCVIRGRAALRRQWLVSALAIALLCVPEAIAALRRGSNSIDWIASPRLSALRQLPLTLGGGSILSYLLLLLGCFALAQAVVRRRDVWKAGFVAAWLVVPVVVDFGFSKLVQPLFISYYLIIVLPALLLLAAAGAWALPGRVLPVACIAVVAAFSVKDLPRWYGRGPLEDLRGATDYVLTHQRPNDGIIYQPGYAADGFQYYERVAHAHGPIPVTLVPSGSVPRRPRLWVVIRDYSTTTNQLDETERALSVRYTRVPLTARFREIGVLLYRARSA